MPRTVIKQEWLKYKGTWKGEPDGFSLHLSIDDRNAFMKEYYMRFNSSNKEPAEYSAASGDTTLIDVDEVLYQKIAASKNGIWG